MPSNKSWIRDQRRLIGQARKRAGLTRSDLARQLGVEEATVGQLESGALVVEHESRARVLNACGFDLRYTQGLIRDRMSLIPLAERHRDYRSALASARAGVQKSEPHPSASSLRGLADMLRALNQPEEARAVLVRAIATAEAEGENVADLQLCLARALQELGDLARSSDRRG